MCEVFGSVKNDGFTSKVRGVKEDQYEEREGQVDPDPFTLLLGQWLNFKLFGITYLVGKKKFKLLFQGSIG